MKTLKKIACIVTMVAMLFSFAGTSFAAAEEMPVIVEPGHMEEPVIAPIFEDAPALTEDQPAMPEDTLSSDEVLADTMELAESEVQVMESEAGEIEPGIEKQAVQINVTEVELWFNNYKNYLEMPSSYKQSYRFKISGTNSQVFWKVETLNDGFAVSVDQSGLVTVQRAGECYVTATVDGKTLKAKVTVRDYGGYIAQRKFDNYVSKKFHSGMTEYEIVEQACKYAASFDYKLYSPSWEGMLIEGSGDCWASTGLILKVCAQFGITARTHDESIPGTDIGHQNALVRIEGKNYIVEAGYEGKAPRPYTIQETSVWDFSYQEDGTIAINRYNGFSSNVKIPGELAGKPVTRIGYSSFMYFDPGIKHSSNVPIKSVTIPDTVTRIDPWAFAYTELESVVIPDSVTELWDNAFTYAPLNKGVTLGRGIKEIKDGTFTGTKLKSIVIPDSVEVIGIEAFSNSSLESITFGTGLKKISDMAFSCSKLKNVILPNSLQSIGNGAFEGIPTLKEITVPKNTKIEGKHIFFSSSAYLDHTNNAVVYCYKNSPMHKYMAENWKNTQGGKTYRVYYAFRDNSKISDCKITLGKSSAAKLNPDVTIKNGNATLKKNVDYKLSYSNDTANGTGKVTITGLGRYSGKVAKSYRLNLAAKPTAPVIGNIFNSGTSPLYIYMAIGNLSNVSGYQIYRAPGDYSSKGFTGDYKKITTLKLSSGQSAAYFDYDVNNGQAYSYKVRAFNKVGNYTAYSDFSIPRCVTALLWD